jgi:hypothetical protein
LIEAQQAKLADLLEVLDADPCGADHFDEVLRRWRVPSCRATLEFFSRVGC